MEKGPAQPNFYEISQERKSLRKTLAESEELGVPEKITEKLKAGLRTVQEQAEKFSIEEAGGLSQAKEALRKEKEKAESSKWIDEVAIAKEIGKDYEAVSKFQDELSGLADFEMSQLQKNRADPYAGKFYKNIRGEILEEKTALAEKIRKIEAENPAAYRASELVSYKKGLHQEGHIAPTPSVKEALSEIGLRMISGKPMFLHGPTGGGKTSLARFAAKQFTGKDAEMVYCTPQTREANIWGKTGIRPAGGGAIETVDIYGPLAKAMQEGKTVIFDEFTALPKEQMVFIKGIFNAKIGDSVNVVGNGKTKIAPGFQMIFTANLKSEKNPERQELPPEIAREFEQNNLKIDYTPKDEAYDIMLARLMNKDGSVDMSYYDLNETLPKFAEAIAEIQIAYTDKESDNIARLTGTKDASGKTQGLKKLVMTQGTVENILDAWRIEKETKKDDASFAEFLDSRLKRALTFEEYSEKDRILAAKILASKGFLRTLSAKDLNLPQAVFDVDAIRKLRGEKAATEIKLKSGNEKHISLKELADLDPFGKRQKKAAEHAMRFLPESEEKSKEARKEFAELINREQKKLREFFGYGIDVPPLPEDITPEQYEKWKELGFELHYLPEEDLTKERDLPGWKKKPEDWFYDKIQEGKISEDATKLPGAWILADSREKPQYNDGDQTYEDDEKIGKVLKKLRANGAIKDFKKEDSRFNISWDELNKTEMKEALAEILNTDPQNLRLPRAIEWNYLGNAFYERWGKTSTWEWFEDEYDKGWFRLHSGLAGLGSLSGVGCHGPVFRVDALGFRPLVVFSSTK